MTTVEPAARAATRDGRLRRLAGLRRAAAGVSQPWSTALVTRCRSESATASSTRVSSSTSSPVEHERDVLARVVRAAGGQLADQLGEAGDHPAHRHHRQAHRAVADVGRAGSGRPRRGPSSSRVAAPSWSPRATRRVQRLGRSACSARQPGERLAHRPGRRAGARRQGRPARGRAGRSGGRRARPRRRRRAGRAPGGSGPGSSRRRGRAGRRPRSSSSAASRGTATGSSPATGGVEGGDHGGELVGADRPRRRRAASG